MAGEQQAKYMVILCDLTKEMATAEAYWTDELPKGLNPVSAETTETPHGSPIHLPHGGPKAIYLTNPCSWYYNGNAWYRV